MAVRKRDSRQSNVVGLTDAIPNRRALARKRATAAVLAGAVAAQFSPTASADNFTLNGNDPVGTSSFTTPLTGATAAGWSSGLAPSAGNTYEVTGTSISNYLLRTPADAASYTFAGDSLQIDAQGRFILKETGTSTITINNLILNGGEMDLSPTSGTFTETLAGGITLNAGTTSTIISGVTTGTFTINSLISGSGNVNFGGSSIIAGMGTSGVIPSAGPINLTAAETYTGATNLSAGTLTLNGANGALTATSALALFGGTLNLDSTTTNNNNRINDAAPISLSGGNFVLKGNASGTNEVVGAMSGLGGSTVTVTFTTASSSLTAASLTHAAGNGSILVNGAGLGRDAATAAGRFFVNTTPTLVGTTASTAGINAAAQNTVIVPFLVGEATATTGGIGTVTGTANTFVTYNAATGFRPLNPTDEFTQNSIIAGNNTRITAATTSGSTASINSLLIAGGNLTITDGTTLTDTSGAVLFAATNTIAPSASTGALAFGANEAMITAANGVTGTITAPITGTGGLTLTSLGSGVLTISTGAVSPLGGITGAISKAGAGTANINSTTASFLPSASTNAINVEGGTLVFANTTSTALTNPIGTGLITITPGATLSFGLAGQTGSTFANSIVVANANPSGVAILQNTSGAVPFSGSLTFAPGAFIPTLRLQNTNGTTAALTISGAITGTGNIQFNGTGNGSPITLSGSVNNVGSLVNIGTNATAASVATINGAIGSNVGFITQAGASLFTINGAITLGGDRAYSSSGAGNFTLTNITGTATAGNTQTITFNYTSSGQILDPTGIISNGAGGGKVAVVVNGTAGATGVVAMGGASTYSGGTILNAGSTFVTQGSSTGPAGAPTNGPVGTGLLTLAGGAIRSTTGVDTTVGNTVLVTADTTFATAGAGTDRNFTFSGPVTLSGTRTFTVNTSPLTAATGVFFTGTLAGTGPTDGLIKAGTGSLVLAGSTTYGGTTAINAGVLEFANAAALPTGAINVAAAGGIGLAVGTGGFSTTDLDNLFNSVTGTPVTVGSNSNVNVNSASFIGIDPIAASLTYAIPGASTHGLAKIGPNTLLLNTANNYSGGTTLNGGTLSVGDKGSLGSGTLTVLSGTITAANDLSGANKVANNVTLSGPLTIGGTNNIDFGGTFTGNTQVLTVTNTGTTTLSGSTTAATVLKTLILSGGAASNFVIGPGGLSISNLGSTVINATTGGTISGGQLTLSSNSATDGPDVVTAAGTTLTINSVIASSFSGNTGPFEELTPGGTIVLTGQNTYGGATILNSSGVLSVATIGNAGVVGNAGTGSSFIFGGGTLRYTGAAATTDRVLNFSGTTAGGAVDASGTGLIEFTSTAAINSGAGTKTITLTGTGLGQLDGVIQNNSATNLTNVSKTGTGTWSLKAAETYTGSTSVSNGTLQLLGTASLSNTAITVSGSGTFLPMPGATIGSTAAVTVNSGGTFSLADGTINTFNIPNAGTGLTLNNSGNLSFDLNTTTSDLLTITKGVETGTTSLNLLGTPTPGTTYTLITASDGTSTLNGGSYGIGATAPGYSYVVTATATSVKVLAVSAAGTSVYWTGLQGTAWNGLTGTTTNFAEQYTGGTSNQIPGPTSNVFFTASNVSAPVNSTLGQGFTINSLNFTGTGTPAATNAVTIGGTSVLTIVPAAGYTDQNGVTYAAGTGIVVQAGSASHTISAPVALGATQTWEIDNAPANPLVVSGVVSGGFGLTKSGIGTLRLGAPATVVTNTFTGPINVTGGLLSYTGTGGSADPAPLGSGAKTITLTNGGGVQVTAALSNPTSGGKSFVIGTGGGVFDVQTGAGLQLDDANQFGGTGDLTVTGAGTGFVYLNNQAFNFSGNVTVNNVILRLGTNSVLGTTTGRSITVNGNSTTGGGVLEFNNAGLILPANTSITLNGTGIASGGALTATAAYTLASNIALATDTAIGGTATLTSTGVISGPGALTKVGANTIILTGTNTYTGSTSISAGTLQIGNAGTTGSLSTTGAFVNNGTFIINRTNAVTQGTDFSSSGITGTGALTQAGTGTTTLTATNAYTGATTVSAGKLVLGNGGNLGATAVSVTGSGSFAATPGLSGATTALGSTLTMAAGTAFTMADGVTSTANVTGAATLSPATGTAPSFTFDVDGANNGVSDVLAIGGAATVGASKVTIFLNGIGSMAAPGNVYTFITAGSGLTPANFTLGNPNGRVVFGSSAFLATLSGTATTESVTLGAGGVAAAYFTGNASPSVLNATSNGGATTNFATDIAGTTDLGTQPTSFTDVFFTAQTVTTPVTVTTLGQDTSYNSLNFTSGAPAVTLNESGAFKLTLGAGITDASGAPQTVNVPLVLTAAQTVSNSGTALLTIGGPITDGGFTLTTAGTGNITFSGINSGAGGLTTGGTGTVTLAAAQAYTGATTVGTGTLVPTVSQTLTGGLTFGATPNAATAGTLDLTNASATFGGPLLVQTTSATANTVTVGAGKTLTINGNVTIGPVATAANQVSKLTIGGGGAFNVTTAAGGVVRIGGNAPANSFSEAATLDLTGLSSVNINVSATGTVGVANIAPTNVAGNQAALLLPTPTAGILPTTPVTTITAGNLNAGDGSGAGSGANQTNSITLGTGLTTLNVNAVNIGTGGRDYGQLTFAPGNGTLKLRAADGTSRAAINVGTGTSASGVAPGTGVTNNVDLTGHSVDLLVGTLAVGAQNRNNNVTNSFSVDTGTLNATGVVIATNTGTASGTVVTGIVDTSNVNVGGTAAVTIGAGGIDIGNGATAVTATSTHTLVGNFNLTGGTVTVANNPTFGAAIRMSNNTIATGLTANSFLNLTGGTLTVAGDIIKGSSTGAGTATILLDGSTLDLGGHNIGSAGAAINTVTLASGTLQNVGQINNGAGVTKTTTGTLVLAGTNAYTGGTNIAGGILRVSGDANLGNAAGAVTVGPGTLEGTASFTTARGVTLSNAASTLLVDPAAIMTVTGKVTGSGTLNATGAGTLVLAGTVANDYTGATNISNGLVLADTTGGSSTGTGPVAVGAGGKLAGKGTVGGTVTLTSGGQISAGDSVTDPSQVGQLTVAGGVSFGNNSSYVWKVKDGSALGTGPAASYDVISAQSLALNLTGGAKFSLSILGSQTLPQGNATAPTPFTYELFQLPGATQSLVDQLNANVQFVVPDNPSIDTSKFTFQLDTAGKTLTGNNGSGGTLLSSAAGIDLVYTPTPEPVVTGILGVLSLALGARPRRRRREAAEVRQAVNG